MRKGIKIFLSFISSIILLIIVFPVLASILLSSYHIQNWVAGKATGYLSRKLETTVSLDHIGIKLFNRVSLDGFYVEDLQGDTLMYVGHLDVGFRGYNPVSGVLRLGEVLIDGADFRLQQDSTGTMNLKYITEKLRREHPLQQRKPFILQATRLRIDNARFRLRKFEIRERLPGGIDFDDMDIRDIALDVERIGLIDDSIQARIHRISAREKSGFFLERLSAEQARVSSRGIHLEKFRMNDLYSQIVMPRLQLDYPYWRAFNNYIEEVRMYAAPQQSTLAFRTIGWFAPALQHWESVVQLDGTFQGTVASLSGQFHPARIGDTRLEARFTITGLPEIAETRFELDIQELLTHPEDAAAIVKDVSGKELDGLSPILSRLEDMRIQGTFDGLLTDFVAEGRLESAPGEVDFDLRLSPEPGGNSHLDGSLRLDHFTLGPVLNLPELEEVSFSARVRGILGPDSLRLGTRAHADRIRYKNYMYRQIDLDGVIGKRFYQGTLHSQDPNIDFRLQGEVDFQDEIPRYDFHLALNRLDLNRLNINRRDSVSILRTDLRLKARGTTVDDVTGNGMITDLVYIFPRDTLRCSEISLLGDNVSEQKRIALQSDFLDAELTSRLNIADLLPYVRQTLHHYLPTLDSIRRAPLPEDLQDRLDRNGLNNAQNYYGLKARIKENGTFVSALLPGLYISPGTDFSLLFNPALRDFSLVLDSELIEYKSLYAANLNLTNRNQADSIALYLRTDEAGVGNFFMPDLTVHAGVRENRIYLSAGFNNPYNGMSAMINTVSRLSPDTVNRKTRFDTRFTASRIQIGEQEWRVTAPSIVWGGDAIEVNRFRMMTEGQHFMLDGRISPLPADTLHLSMNNFDLSPLSGLIDRHGYHLTGRTNGHADLIAGKGDALLYGRIEFHDMEVNDKPLSNSIFTSEWDPLNDRVRMSMVLENQDTVLWGRYRPGEQRYYLNAQIPGIDLQLLSPVLDGVLTDIEGTATANLILQGTGGVPSLNGTISASDFAGTVDFTRARYHLKDATVLVEDNNLILPSTPLYDQEGGEGDVELTLRTRYFSQMSYQVKVQPRRMLALNTTVQDNDYFYGKVYASGTVSITGDRRGVEMNMDIVTEDNSTFIMPLSGASSISEADFIVFEDPNAPPPESPLSRYEMRQRNRRRNAPVPGDLDIKMTIDVRPNTEVQLQFDPQLGDIIYATGTGILDLHIRPKENLLTMFGDYRIHEGRYNFTLMSILSKRFDIEQNGLIQWIGDPLDAILDITAIYRLRASGALFGLKQSIPVECKLLLTDRLSQPTINFDIEVPTFDPELQTILQSVMSTNEMKSQQFVWLLMARTFYVDSGEGDLGNIGTTASAATGIEFLTNQLSSWLSTDRFSFNVGYNRSADQTLSDELEGMFSGEIIPNKLLFEGEVNYNLGDKDADPREHQFSGDFYLTYIIGRSGNLHTKVFSRTIDRYDENQGLQEQGIGLYYKRDFNHWWEIFRRQRRWNRMAPSSEEEEVLQAESEHEKPILIEGAIEGAEPFRLLPE